MDYLRYNSNLSAEHHHSINRRINLIQAAAYNIEYGSQEIKTNAKADGISNTNTIQGVKSSTRDLGFPPLDPARIRKAELIAYTPKFIEKVFGCDSAPPESFPSKILLPAFILNIMNRTRLNTSTLTTAFFYLNRLKQLHPRCKGSAGSGYRLFLAAIILAAKYMYDDTFDNTAWATVSSGLFSLEEVNHMEREMLSFLDFTLFIRQTDWDDFSQNLISDISSSRNIYNQSHKSYITPISSTEDLHLLPAHLNSNSCQLSSNKPSSTLNYIQNSGVKAEGVMRP